MLSTLLILSLAWSFSSPAHAQQGDDSSASSSTETGDDTGEEDASAPPLPDDEEPGEVVVVTGARRSESLSETVVTTDVVTREQVEESGASDASEVLETVPGVVVYRSFRGAGVQMQGLDSQYVLVLVNGQRMTGSKDGVLDLSRIPAERIERIEIVKGAASALYGSDAIAGVINIITREPDQPWSSQTVGSYGSRNTLDLSETVGLKRDRWSAGLNLGTHSTDGYDWDPTDAQTDGNASDQYAVEGDLTADLTPDLRVLADGGYRLRDSTGVDEVQAATFDRRNLTEDADLRLGMELLPSEASKLSAHLSGALYRDQYSQDQRGSDALDQYEDSRDTSAQLDLQWDQVWGRNVISVGAEGLRETLVSPRLTQDGERYRGAFYVQDELRVGPRQQLAIVPGARLDADSWFGLQPTPRVALRWDATEHLAFRLNTGFGFRAPTFKEMFLLFENPTAGYMVQGNPDLQPEHSLGLTGGFESSIGRHLQIRLDGFHTALDNLITIEFVDEATAETPAAYSYVNIARATSTGAEGSVRVRLDEWLTTDLGYTYTRTWDLDAQRDLDGRARNRGTVGLTGRVPALLVEATLRGEIVGPTTFYVWDDVAQVEERVDADPYANLKLRVEKTVLPRLAEGGSSLLPAGLRIFAGVDNLLNAGDALYIHLDPRLFYGGLIFDLPGPDDGGT